MRTEQEVDKMIKEMRERTKGHYLTQGVSFNKNCPRQMNLLKQSLMYSNSFSGLIKEVLAVNFRGGTDVPSLSNSYITMEQPKSKSIDGWF